jgi:hypothetical protein
MLPAVTHGEGEGRVPPLTSECLESILKDAFTAHTNAILMADSAQAYQSLQVGVHGICEKYLVSHLKMFKGLQLLFLRMGIS